MDKKLIICAAIAVTITAALCSCGSNNYSNGYTYDKDTTAATTTTKSTYNADTNNYTYDNGNDKDDDLADGEYWCMGKGDTCHNKTNSPTDLYCHACDPDDNNIEGDQRTTDGVVGDNDGNGTVDEHDWETEWNDYLDNKLDDYDYDYGF